MVSKGDKVEVYSWGKRKMPKELRYGRVELVTFDYFGHIVCDVMILDGEQDSFLVTEVPLAYVKKIG